MTGIIRTKNMTGFSRNIENSAGTAANTVKMEVKRPLFFTLCVFYQCFWILINDKISRLPTFAAVLGRHKFGISTNRKTIIIVDNNIK